ncbi:group 1 glycosyl transferase [Tolypothrix tenuis PCC 7101]|uniref:Group 1 glycosyl transferase n=1 Tax=Tolypothrix tenuis PCC 7101 TaxID=231146 RepID=A0A1Z4MXF1_9CYAN|nr:glycosyltransferase [Aulosira sp. FACHB-113]BAY98119.1 group 1 glycosyl transferase [Tolypothrix tenuis PCC 7101]BAZ77962.1 group 1 glycosyl transferase [Aulosira laxa NIES-50]
MTRLLFITERFAPDLGGLARSATRLVGTLSQLGMEIDVVTWSRYLQPGEVLPPETKEANIRVYRIGLYRHWDMTMPHTLNVLEWLHSVHSYDAVWGHYLFPSGFLATWFAGLVGLASTVSARGNDIDREMFPPGDFARLQWTLQHAKVITAVSADMSRKIQLLSGRDDVLVLKNAVDTEIFAPQNNPTPQAKREGITREFLGITPDEMVLGFCGELREKKGQQFLLNALTTVRQVHPACLLIIGEVRASQESVLQLYKAHQPENAQRIIVTGHLPQPEIVAEYLRLCDVYLQPSLWEGMPNALLETMACGCCCIASDAGGIPEVITHSKNGFLLPRSHLHKLGEAVLEFLAMTTEEKTQVSQAARDRILIEHSLAQEKLQLQTLMARLIPNSV